MISPFQMKIQSIERKLKARTRPDGTPRPGFEQNVAVLRAELEMISEKIQAAKENQL